MATDFAPTSPALRFPGLIETAMRAALLEVLAFVRASQNQDSIYEPDPWSFEAPFLSPDWPRS
jgi:hypothetical protein